MHSASSAARTCGATASASLNTATDRIPNSRHARMTLLVGRATAIASALLILAAGITATVAGMGNGAADQAAPLLPREAVETMVLAGNSEAVATQLARALHPRVTQLTVRPHAIKGQPVAAVIRAFAERVVPRALELRAKATG